MRFGLKWPTLRGEEGEDKHGREEMRERMISRERLNERGREEVYRGWGGWGVSDKAKHVIATSTATTPGHSIRLNTTPPEPFAPRRAEMERESGDLWKTPEKEERWWKRERVLGWETNKPLSPVALSGEEAPGAISASEAEEDAPAKSCRWPLHLADSLVSLSLCLFSPVSLSLILYRLLPFSIYLSHSIAPSLSFSLCLIWAGRHTD